MDGQLPSGSFQQQLAAAVSVILRAVPLLSESEAFSSVTESRERRATLQTPQPSPNRNLEERVFRESLTSPNDHDRQLPNGIASGNRSLAHHPSSPPQRFGMGAAMNIRRTIDAMSHRRTSTGSRTRRREPLESPRPQPEKKFKCQFYLLRGPDAFSFERITNTNILLSKSWSCEQVRNAIVAVFTMLESVTFVVRRRAQGGPQKTRKLEDFDGFHPVPDGETFHNRKYLSFFLVPAIELPYDDASDNETERSDVSDADNPTPPNNLEMDTGNDSVEMQSQDDSDAENSILPNNEAQDTENPSDGIGNMENPENLDINISPFPNIREMEQENLTQDSHEVEEINVQTPERAPMVPPTVYGVLFPLRTLEHKIQFFKRNVVKVGEQEIFVKRTSMLRDSIQVLGSQSFQPFLKPAITFIGEPAMDLGGLGREWMYDLSCLMTTEYYESGPLLEGRSNSLFPGIDQSNAALTTIANFCMVSFLFGRYGLRGLAKSFVAFLLTNEEDSPNNWFQYDPEELSLECESALAAVTRLQNDTTYPNLLDSEIRNLEACVPTRAFIRKLQTTTFPEAKDELAFYDVIVKRKRSLSFVKEVLEDLGLLTFVRTNMDCIPLVFPSINLELIPIACILNKIKTIGFEGAPLASEERAKGYMTTYLESISHDNDAIRRLLRAWTGWGDIPGPRDTLLIGEGNGLVFHTCTLKLEIPQRIDEEMFINCVKAATDKSCTYHML